MNHKSFTMVNGYKVFETGEKFTETTWIAERGNIEVTGETMAKVVSLIEERGPSKQAIDTLAQWSVDTPEEIKEIEKQWQTQN